MKKPIMSKTGPKAAPMFKGVTKGVTPKTKATAQSRRKAC